MHAAGVGSPLGLLAFESIELSKNVYRNANMVVLEPAQAPGVVQKNVGIEDEVLTCRGGRDETEVSRLGRRQGTFRLCPRRVLFGDNVRLRIVGLVNHVED